MRKSQTAALLTAVLLCLSGCRQQNKQPTYRTDLTAEAVSVSCMAELPSYSLLSAADEDYIKFRMLLNTSDMESYAVYIQNAGTSIDEVGIVQAASDYTEPLETAIADYLERRNEEWTGQYLV